MSFVSVLTSESSLPMVITLFSPSTTSVSEEISGISPLVCLTCGRRAKSLSESAREDAVRVACSSIAFSLLSIDSSPTAIFVSTTLSTRVLCRAFFSFAFSSSRAFTFASTSESSDSVATSTSPLSEFSSSAFS